MADKEAARLAEHVVRAAFGDLVANVAAVMLNRGRQNIHELCLETKLRPRPVQAVLITLIQHNLAWYCEAEANGQMIEYFEVNVKECLMRLRWGRILSITEEQYGEEGRRIAECLLTRGKARLPDIHAALGLEDATRKGKATKLVLQMLHSAHILPTSGRLFIAPFDDMAAQRRKQQKDLKGGVPSANELANIRIRVLEQTKEARREDMKPEKAIVTGARRKANGVAGGNNKKAKTDDATETVNPAIYLRVNYERYDIILRNDLIEKAAADRWNAAAGKVVKAALLSTIASQDRLGQHVTGPTTAPSILASLTDEERDSLSFGFGATKPTSKSKASELVAAYCAILAGEDNLAAEKSDGVFLEVGSGAKGSGQQYRVGLERVCGRMKRNLLDTVVRERWGDEARRLIKIIEHSGMINEPKIAETALLKLSDVRTLLARLHEANIIELQQIPRGTERAAQRMIFFWHIDLSRTYGSLLASFYKTLANLAQRRAAELERRKALIERANRTDVKSDISLLSERDRKELGEMHEVLVQIALAEMRTELNVFVLRDLPGGPPSTRSDDFLL